MLLFKHLRNMIWLLKEAVSISDVYKFDKKPIDIAFYVLWIQVYFFWSPVLLSEFNFTYNLS